MTDFRNVKLKVLSPEHSAAFQEAAFETGARWVCGQDYARLTNASFLYITETGEIVCSSNEMFFEKSECNEILFTTPAYLKTKIQIRDREHLCFVLEKLRQNGVQDTGRVKTLPLRDGDYIWVGIQGFCWAAAREVISNLSSYKEIFIEKDDAGEMLSEPALANISNTGNQENMESTQKIISSINRAMLRGEYRWPPADGYEKLTDVLQAAHNQAAHGKGKDRHANNLPFHEQRMQTISKLIKSPKGMEFQAIKKLTEGMQFDDHGKREAELLGAINYIAGIVIYFRESRDENQ